MITERKLKIVFYGTDEFAVPSLVAMVEAGWKPASVVTGPDRPAGRNRELKVGPVKQAAQEMGIPVLQPKNLKADDFYESLRSIDPDLQVIVAFRMLPERIWNYPKLGSLNLHASLLPNYRGARPIHWAIMNGENETGVTTFFLKHEIDTGNIILQEKEPIGLEDTFDDLFMRLQDSGASLLIRTLEEIENGTVKPREQILDGTEKLAPKFNKPECEIDWNNSAHEIKNLVRGTNSFPGAWSILNGTRYKIHRVGISETESLSPGEIKSDGNKVLIGSASQDIELLEIQAPGAKKMTTKEFLAGKEI